MTRSRISLPWLAQDAGPGLLAWADNFYIYADTPEKLQTSCFSLLARLAMLGLSFGTYGLVVLRNRYSRDSPIVLDDGRLLVDVQELVALGVLLDYRWHTDKPARHRKLRAVAV